MQVHKFNLEKKNDLQKICITEGTEWIMTFGGILSDIAVSYIVTDALLRILSSIFAV